LLGIAQGIHYPGVILGVYTRISPRVTPGVWPRVALVYIEQLAPGKRGNSPFENSWIPPWNI